MTQGRGELLGPEQIAGDWCDNAYVPAMRIIMDEGLREAFPWKTDGDLYLYIYQLCTISGETDESETGWERQRFEGFEAIVSPP
ncbi:MAG: hypothetical protein ACR2MC_01490 [Actinomycetota bacterium]